MISPRSIPKNWLFALNHSGGKDGQAMYLRLRNLIPADQLIIIHAHLPKVEWPGTEAFIKSTTQHEFFVVQANKTFFEMVDSRQMWPSPEIRQCTSDLKRGPIEKQIRLLCNTRGFDVVINCMGLRAQESSGRKKKPVFRRVNRNCNSKRTWYEWLPIHGKSTNWVFNFIKQNGQEPFWVYGAGMTRKSCAFCIMASEADLCTAAKLMPELAAEYIAKEKEINHTLLMPSKKAGKRFLTDILKPI